jgi:hypothetical protein
MEEFVIEAAKLHAAGRLAFILTIVVAGASLILVNILSARLIDGWRDHIRRRQELIRTLRPVLKASAEVVSRLSDILILHRESFLRTYESYRGADLPSRIRILTPVEMNRIESTAFRLVNFLVLAEEFRRKTSDTPSFGLLERAEYFLQHKIPVALRGNLYQHQMIATEIQEEIAAAALGLLEHRPALEFSVGSLCSFIRSGEYDAELFEVAVKAFLVDTKCLGDDTEIDRTSPSWQHVLTLAHLGVYLIDLFQDLADNCQWEEQRLLFVKVIKGWNTGSVRHRYLYEPGDLQTENFLDTYPGGLVPGSMLLGVLERVVAFCRMGRLFDRRLKFLALYRRGLRFRRRHNTKAIHSWGLRIHGEKRSWTIRLSEDLYTVMREVREYLESRSI